MAADGTQIKQDIDTDLANKGYRGIRIATIIATLKKVVDWVTSAVAGNLATWYGLGTSTPASTNTDTVYRVGNVLIGRSTDDGTGAVLQVDGNVSARTLRATGLLAGGNSPTVAGLGGLGSSGSVSLVAGSMDMAGQVSISTGSDPGNTGFAKLTFSRALPATPKVAVLTPADQLTAQQYSRFVLFIDGPASVTLYSSGTAPAANSSFRFNYLILQ